MSSIHSPRWACLAIAFGLCAWCACCSSGHQDGDSGIQDADAQSDAGDPGRDSGADAQDDASDTGVDASSDTGIDGADSEDAGQDAAGDENPDAGDAGGDQAVATGCAFPYSPLQKHILPGLPPIGEDVEAYDIHQLCTLDYLDVHALALVKAEPTAVVGFGDVSYQATEGYLCRDGQVEQLPAGMFEFSMAHHGWTGMRVAFDGFQYVYDWSEMCIGARPCTSNPDVMNVLRLADSSVVASGVPVTCVGTTMVGIPLPLTPQMRVPAAGLDVTFPMGSTTGDADERPVHDVTLLPVRMDVREATNADFALFLNDHGNDCTDSPCLMVGATGLHLHQDGGAWRADPGSEDLPVVQVTWYGASAYCLWRDWMLLPTEAQWEMAASAAGTRVYPWGDAAPDCDRASFDSCAAGEPLPGCVKAPGTSREGICDLAGNLSEWIADWYQADYYATCTVDCDNPQGPDQPTGAKVVRGGSFASPAGTLRAADRGSAAPGTSAADRGFRCIKWTMPIP